MNAHQRELRILRRANRRFWKSYAKKVKTIERLERSLYHPRSFFHLPCR